MIDLFTYLQSLKFVLRSIIEESFASIKKTQGVVCDHLKVFSFSSDIAYWLATMSLQCD